MVRALMCGDRKWTCQRCPSDWLDNHPDITLVIEGEAPGADTISKMEAKLRNIRLDGYPAQWDIYGKAAGPIRNIQMLKEGRPDIAVAFHNNITESKGTAYMVMLLTKANVPVEIVRCPHG